MDPSLGLVIYLLLGFGTTLILFVAYNAFRTALEDTKLQQVEAKKQDKEKVSTSIQERKPLSELEGVHLKVQRVYPKQQGGQSSSPALPNKTLIRDWNELEMHHLRPILSLT